MSLKCLMRTLPTRLTVHQFGIITIIILNTVPYSINADPNPRASVHPKVLLISFDGFRHDYFDSHGPLPALEALADAGTYVPEVTNVFPTKTFGNHLSIVTGLHPGYHGGYANTIYDRDTGQVVSLFSDAGEKFVGRNPGVQAQIHIIRKHPGQNMLLKCLMRTLPTRLTVHQFGIITIIILNTVPYSINADPNPRASVHPKVLLISFDGFRHDYFDSHGPLPALEALADAGTYVPEVTNVFPTKTFGNHLSLVTGLHPGYHGGYANTIYDRDTGQVVSLFSDAGEKFVGRNPGVLPLWEDSLQGRPKAGAAGSLHTGAWLGGAQKSVPGLAQKSDLT
ncbi:unnamed protein product, partial [Notodromas monacha]